MPFAPFSYRGPRGFLGPLPPSAGPRGNEGMLTPGNIDLGKRPVVQNADGTISTVRSMSVNFDGVEVLIPTVSEGGRIMGEDEAIKAYLSTGRHLGIFRSPADATKYAERLHSDQERIYAGKRRSRP